MGRSRKRLGLGSKIFEKEAESFAFARLKLEFSLGRLISMMHTMPLGKNWERLVMGWMGGQNSGYS